MPQIRLKQINDQELSTYVSGVWSQNASSLAAGINDNPTVLDYSYNNSSASVSSKYFNIFDSSADVSASLPSVQDKKRFLFKNINVGILSITPSGNQKIDSFNDVKLYSGQSLEILGVSQSAFTGWVTLNSNGGLS